jgi:branched-chain amino acid transport system permease protein
MALLLGLMIALGLLPLYVDQPYIPHILTTVFINIMLAVSLRCSLMTGLFNIGHAAFFALGAYGSAILAIQLGIPSGVSLLLGGLIAALMSLLIGIVILRLRGIYFAMVSIAVVEVIRVALNKGGDLTGGYSGLGNIPTLVIFGNNITGVDEFYWFGFVLMLLTIFFLYRLEIGRIGMTWKAISQSENIAASVGVNIMLYKTVAFVIGSFFAGLAGGFFAYFMGFLGPDTFGFFASVKMLIYNYVGGTALLAGPIGGAMLLTLISEPFRGFTYYEVIFFSIALIVVIVFLPGGIITLPQKLRLRKKYDYPT